MVQSSHKKTLQIRKPVDANRPKADDKRLQYACFGRAPSPPLKIRRSKKGNAPGPSMLFVLAFFCVNFLILTWQCWVSETPAILELMNVCAIFVPTSAVGHGLPYSQYSTLKPSTCYVALNLASKNCLVSLIVMS